MRSSDSPTGNTYRPLASARARTANGYRLAILAAFVAGTLLFSLIGVPVTLPVFGTLGFWAAAVLGYRVWLGRIRTVSAANRLQFVAYLGDLTLLTLAYAVLGGAWWLGAATHTLIATFSLASLPRREALIVTGAAVMAYVGLLYAQTSGLVAGQPLFGLPVLAGNPKLAILIGTSALIPLLASVAVQNTFVRIMRRAQERYRLLLESAPDMIISTDLQGIVVSINAATRAQSGRTDAEMLGRPLAGLVIADDRHLAAEHLGAAAAGKSGEIELRYGVADGATLWVRCNCNPIWEDNRITGVLLVARDITASKHNEIALRESENRLRQSQKMEAVGLLAGGVAHDFNNLLTVIGLHSESALAALPRVHPQRDSIEEIRKAGESAAHLTRQLLAFSRKQLLQPQILDLNRIVAAMEGLLQRLIGAHIAIRTQLADDLQPVTADPGQLEQIVLNLCVNARDAMPRGGTLTLATANVTVDESYAEPNHGLAPGTYVRLSVSDTGEGMDKDTVTHVFEPFFSTKPVGEGTGLGLSTVHGIVAQSGGAVNVYSEVGRGSVFNVYLPAGPADGTEQPRGEIREFSPSGNETILLVDDTDGIRRIVELTLRKAGYTVLTADGARTALRLQAAHPDPIAMLLTDVIMPEMTGPEVAHRVREQRPDIRVLYMSGYARDAVLTPGGTGVGEAFLQKPFTSEQLLACVRANLARP